MKNSIRSTRLTEISKRRIEEKRVYDLAIMEGETRVLSPTSKSLKAHCEKIEVASLDDLKGIIGVPKKLSTGGRTPALDELKRTEGRSSGRAVTLREGQSDSSLGDDIIHNVADSGRMRLMERMFSRTIDPDVLDRDEKDFERIVAIKVARAAISDHLYSNAPIASSTRDLVSSYLSRRRVLVFTAIFGNISVANGATLQVNAGILAVNANKIRLYGSGKIRCQGPTTFDAQSVKGNIKPIEFIATTELTGPVTPVFP